MSMHILNRLKVEVRRLKRAMICRSGPLLIPLIRTFAKNLALTYGSSKSHDGLGAQLHRIVAIYSLARVLNLPYIHTEIKHTTWHPLDNFRDRNDFRAYVNEVNSLFRIESDVFETPKLSIDIPKLNFLRLLSLSIKSRFFKDQYLLSICEPFGVVDFISNGFELIPEFSRFNQLIANEKFSTPNRLITIHYRHGSGNFALYHDQTSPRQLPLNFFNTQLQNALASIDSHDTSVLFVTDAPESDTNFPIPEDQMTLWENTPGFENGILKIKGLPDSIIRGAFGELPNFSIIRGGNPILALILMASSDYLIMSRSSLSYVAGLYCKGAVYYPHDFWHPPQKNWVY